jgi:hypothetical protein
VGSSIHAWTALISVILGSLSLGYAIGGKLADRYPSYTILSMLFFLSAILVALIKFLEMLLLPLTSVILDIRTLSVILSLGLFALPSMLLDFTVYNTTFLHSLTEGNDGNLSALSTLGSIIRYSYWILLLEPLPWQSYIWFRYSGFLWVLVWFKGKKTGTVTAAFEYFRWFG